MELRRVFLVTMLFTLALLTFHTNVQAVPNCHDDCEWVWFTATLYCDLNYYAYTPEWCTCIWIADSAFYSCLVIECEEEIPPPWPPVGC